MITLAISEEVFGAKTTDRLEVSFQSETITLADLIQAKATAQVNAAIKTGHPATVSHHFLSEKEQLLNKEIIESKEVKAALDPERAGYEALAAFQKNAFFVIVDGEPKGDLQEEITLTAHSKVHFMRLMPLVGG